MDALEFVKHILNIVFYFYHYYGICRIIIDSIFLRLSRFMRICGSILISLLFLGCRKINGGSVAGVLCLFLGSRLGSELRLFCLRFGDSLSMLFLF